jgi:carboxypeptidase C (cathepsin A)
MIWELAAYIVFVVVVVILLVAVYKTHLRAKRLANNLIQTAIDNTIFKDKIEELSSKLELIELQRTDEFVKFLSESRDWAFQYIEDVQAAIQYLKDAMEEGNEEKINDAYHNLVELLPKEENK